MEAVVRARGGGGGAAADASSRVGEVLNSARPRQRSDVRSLARARARLVCVDRQRKNHIHPPRTARLSPHAVILCTLSLCHHIFITVAHAVVSAAQGVHRPQRACLINCDQADLKGDHNGQLGGGESIEHL